MKGTIPQLYLLPSGQREGETNQLGQSNIPWLRAVHHAEEEDRFKEKGQELRPNATSETNVLEEDVTGDASPGT